MKIKMLGSAMLCCMLVVSLTSGASAIENINLAGSTETSTAISTFAGAKVTCNVTIAEPNGTFTQKQILIDVPIAATNTEAQNSIMAAAEATAFPARTPRFSSKTIYEKTGRVISIESSGNGSVAAAFTLDANYDMLGVYFSNISPYVTSMNCSLMNTDYGTTNVYWLHQSLSGSNNKTCSVFFQKGDKTDGGIVPAMLQGQNLNVIASCTTSQAGIGGIADVKVTGYQGIF